MTSGECRVSIDSLANRSQNRFHARDRRTLYREKIHEKYSRSGCSGHGHDVAGFCQTLSEGCQDTEVKALRDKGAALHKSGKHGESIKVLHKAIKILGVEPYKAM
jgi:hypothetical protein